MNKEFSNIIIFNNQDIHFIIEKLEKMITDLDYTVSSDEGSDIMVEIIQDNINNICVISSDYFSFKNINENKSIIRKIAKRVAQDTFMITSKENIAVLEKYSFNKRIYDYISLGDKEELAKLGYNESYAKCMSPQIWTNHFVGRNTINDLNKILEEESTYFNNFEILVDILKLYGIKYELATYSYGSNIKNLDVISKVLYFSKKNP